MLGDLIGLRDGRRRAPADRPRIRCSAPLPLGVLAAASVFNYSLPGLLWIGAIAVAVVAARFLVVPRPAARSRLALRGSRPTRPAAFA